MKIVGVIPAYNEAGRIGETVNKCRGFFDEIIVVDDGSRDESAKQAEEAGAMVYRHIINRGQGAALKTGTIAAVQRGAEIIVHIDADGQHDPEFVPKLIEPIKKGEAEVTLGSRFLGLEAENMPLMRKMLLKAAKQFNIFALGIPRSVTDPQSGMRAFRASAVPLLDFKQNHMAHASELLRLIVRSGLKWQEVPIKVVYNQETLGKGQKNLDALKIAWQLLIGTVIK